MRQRSRRLPWWEWIVLAAALLLPGYALSPLLVNLLPFRVLPSVAARAKQRVSLLRPGMTEQEVWSTLGLTRSGFRARISGSGPPNAFPANYVLWPGYVLHTRWNYKTKPITLVEAEFRDHLY
jgi:hypothetical protein